MMYVGVDVHKKVCRAAIVDDDSEVVDKFMFKNSLQGIEGFTVMLEAFRTKVLVAVESTANLWIRLYDCLEDHGVRVVLSDPSRTRLITEAKVRRIVLTLESLLGC